MVKAASILTGLTLLLGQVYNSAVYGYYQWQYDYFANVLCENQDQPELHCNGKCQLAEMLAPAEDTPQPDQMPAFVPAPDLFFLALSAEEPALADADRMAIERAVPGLLSRFPEMPSPPPRRWV